MAIQVSKNKNYVYGFFVMMFFSSCIKGNFSILEILGSEKNVSDLKWDHGETKINFARTVEGTPGEIVEFTLRNNSSLPAVNCSSIQISDSDNFKVTEDNCGTELGAGESCQVSVQALPTSPGVKEVSLQISCSINSVTNSPVQEAAVEVSSFQLSWDDTEVYFFGNVQTSTSSGNTMYYNLTNNGSSPATQCSAPFLSDPINFRIVYDTCGTSDLAGGDSCTVGIEDQPTLVGDLKTSILRTCSDGVKDVTVATQRNHTLVTGYVLNPSPTMTDLTNVDEISSGEHHMCAVVNIASGNAITKCWGLGWYGQLGNGDLDHRLTATNTVNLPKVGHLSVGAWNSCVVIGFGVDAGKMKCWGENSHGELGRGYASGYKPLPEFVSNLTDIIQVQTAGYRSCALTSLGAVKCWGSNAWGEVGDGSFSAQYSPTTIITSGATKIMLGYDHGCAFMSTNPAVAGADAGKIKCWGGNNYGQILGLATYGPFSGPGAPVNIIGLEVADVKELSLSVGDNHTCALMNDQTVKCWGQNDSGQLGDGTTTNRTSMVTVLTAPGTPLTDVAKIYLGRAQSCAILTDKTAKCWGSNTRSQLGDGTQINSSYAVTVLDDYDRNETMDGPMTDIGELATSGEFVCARIVSGPHAKKVKCWGGNPYGQLGNGTQAFSHPAPVFVQEQN